MDDIDIAIAAAWERVKVLIADKPAELRKRSRGSSGRR